jgi:hypothetical protein
MPVEAPRLRVLLVPAAILTLVAAFAVLLPAQASAQSCTTDHPLFIEEVDVRADDSKFDENSQILDDKGAYLHAGDRIETKLEVVNVLGSTCDQIADTPTDDLSLEITYGWDSDAAPDEPMASDEKRTESHPICGGRLGPGEDPCNPGWFDLPSVGNREIVDEPGEHRLRFMITNGDGRELAGAERVLVVERQPDLVPAQDDPIVWAEEYRQSETLRSTTYTDQGETAFDVNVTNDGTYPNWNPNAGATYHGGSAYDSPTDDDLGPDDHQNTTDDFGDDTEYQDNMYSGTGDTEGPVCHWKDDNDGDNTPGPDEPLCSYRRGLETGVPIAWEAREATDGSGTGPLIGAGFDESYTFAGDASSKEKNDTIIHDAGECGSPQDGGCTSEDEIQTITIDGPDRQYQPGEYVYTATINENENGQSITPEADLGNNEESTDIEILGVDLELQDINLRVSDRQTLCTSTQDTCIQGTNAIEVEPIIANDGSDIEACESGDGPCDRGWRGSISLKVGQSAEEVAEDATDDEYKLWNTADHRSIPDVDDDTGLWTGEDPINGPVEVDIEEGGRTTLIVRLDQAISYEDDTRMIDDETGRVAEFTDEHGCPEGYDEPSENWDDSALHSAMDDTAPPVEVANNTWCIDLYFNDTEPPQVNSQSIQDATGDVPEIGQGENATFQADVTDNAGLDEVTAVFSTLEGETVLTRPMHLNESDNADPDTWEVNQSFSNVTGSLVYTVEANDTVGNTVSSDGLEFDVEELAKEIDKAVGTDTVNDQPPPAETEDAPRYRGSADEPENTFNVTFNVSDTGRPPDDPTGKEVVLNDPDGSERARVDARPLTACEAGGTAGDGSTMYGPNCDDENTDPGVDPVNERTWWFVDNTEHYQDVENISMPWVGEFNITVSVNDTFDQVNRSNFTFELRDRVNDNGLVEPNVTEVDVSGTQLAPGDSLSASAYAKDVLRVERVYLNVTKPSGDTTEAPLSRASTDDAETNNGTYSGAFVAGADGDVFDQAGDYEVDLVAEDFAGNLNRTQVGPITVAAGEAPTIEAFFTEPADEVEGGTNLTIAARIDAETALSEKTVTLTLPDGSTEEHELEYDEDLDRYETNVTPEPVLDGERETWEMELVASDFAAQADSATGSIDVVANTAPRATQWRPAVPGEEIPYGDPLPTISVRLVDGNGINESSIEMAVDGETVYEDGAGAAERTPIADCSQCYKLTYTPEAAYEHGDQVRAEVRATDVSDEQLTSEWQVHQFEVDAEGPSASVSMTPSFEDEGTTIVGATTDINVTVDDADAGPGELRLEVASLAGSTRATVEEQTFEDGEATVRLPDFEDAFRGHGAYQIVAYPTDAVGNDGDAVETQVQYDEAPPKIFLEPQLGQPASVITVNVTDRSPVDEVTVRFTADGGPERELALETDSGLWTGQIVDPETGDAYPENTTIEYTVHAADTWGNTGSKGPNQFLAGNTPPDVAFESPSTSQVLSGSVDIQWSATDDETPDEELNISLWYKQPDGDPREIPDATGLDNVGQHTVDTTLLPNGNLQLQVIAFDGATFSQATVNVTVRNLGEAFTGPQLSGAESVEGRPTVGPGEETSFTVQIDQNVRAAWANVTQGGEVVTSYRLEDRGGGTWGTTFTAPDEEGDYEVSLSALTAEGPVEAESAYAFQVSGDDKSFVSEWTILSVLFAAAVAVGAFGLAREWD